MAGTILVLLGFVLGALHDLASYRRTPVVKPVLVGLTALAHLSGAWLLLVRSPKRPFPKAVSRVAFGTSVVAFLGMLYSIAVEIPFRKAWIDRGHTGDLVTSGTYSVSRHPGVLWTAIWVPSAAVASGSRDLLRCWPAVIVGDVAHVWAQDRWLLPRVFGEDYREYQRRTPFLVPALRRRSES